tara:strand:- start:3275 stop:3985 length:711 start_codon:yes stop_codon:yes gene_type:complete
MKKLFLLSMFFSVSYGQKNILFTQTQLTGQSEINMIQNRNFQLLPEVARSFELMKEAALKDSINIKIVSSFRSFNKQKEIWNRKFKKNDSLGFSKNKNILKIIEYSTIPGTSRHHWGTDIDIVDDNFKPEGDVLLTEKFYNDGPYVQLKKWLDMNSEKFGFYIVYTKNSKRKGFKHEPWHYSFKPISKDILNELLKVNFSKLFIENEVLGSEYFTIDFIKYYKENFLLGISSELKY